MNLIIFLCAAKIFDVSSADNKKISCDENSSNGHCEILTTGIDSMGVSVSISAKSNETKWLSMWNNKKIFYLPTDLDQTFSNLIQIVAADCSIKSIHKENFKNLKNLKYLWLDGNRLEEVAINTFDDLESLEDLHLSESLSF